MAIPATKLNSDPRETIGRNTVTDVSRSRVISTHRKTERPSVYFVSTPAAKDGMLGLHSTTL